MRLSVILMAGSECCDWKWVGREWVKSTEINWATVRSRCENSGGPVRFRLCYWIAKGGTMDERSVEKIKYVSSTKNLRYNHSYNFGGLDPCKFLRNDVIDFCEGMPDGLNEVTVVLGFVSEFSEMPNGSRGRRHWEGEGMKNKWTLGAKSARREDGVDQGEDAVRQGRKNSDKRRKHRKGR